MTPTTIEKLREDLEYKFTDYIANANLINGIDGVKIARKCAEIVVSFIQHFDPKTTDKGGKFVPEKDQTATPPMPDLTNPDWEDQFDKDWVGFYGRDCYKSDKAWTKEYIRQQLLSQLEEVEREVIGEDENGYYNQSGRFREGESAEQFAQNNLRRLLRSKLSTLKDKLKGEDKEECTHDNILQVIASKNEPTSTFCKKCGKKLLPSSDSTKKDKLEVTSKK